MLVLHPWAQRCSCQGLGPPMWTSVLYWAHIQRQAGFCVMLTLSFSVPRPRRSSSAWPSSPSPASRASSLARSPVACGLAPSSPDC